MSFARQALIVSRLIFLVAAKRAPGDSEKLPSFSSFIDLYDRSYTAGSKEYTMRRSIYEQRLDQVVQHNQKPHRRWRATVNHLSDRTEAELAQLRGLRVMKSASKSNRAAGVVGVHRSGGQFLGQVRSSVIPEEKSWASLNVMSQDIDQGACGSCWAIATSVMLQANAEINGYNRSFSTQELVDCVPNPHNCGGSGGCQGATVELAMNWAVSQGLATEQVTPYTGTDGTCAKTDPAMLLERYQNSFDDMISVGFHESQTSSLGLSTLGLKGWSRLPENEYEPLIRAVAEIGPAAVSVAASGWSTYGSGIFDACSADAVIDHAVTLIGYGVDSSAGEKYWLIKNSWGLLWGEKGGTIRLLREVGNAHCGVDSQPKVGTGCDDGPSSVPVCGMCGILYDSVVPHFMHSAP